MHTWCTPGYHLVAIHRDMRNPVNMILTGIAVADCLVMVEYIPFIIHMWRLHDTEIPKEETVINYKNYLSLLTFFTPRCLLGGAYSCCSTSTSQ